MKVVNPDELVAKVNMGEDKTGRDKVDGEKNLGQDIMVFLTGDIAPASEKC